MSELQTESSLSGAPLPGRMARAWSDLRLAARGTTHDYTTGSIDRSIFLLAVPMVLEMLMESIFVVVDIFWVARLGADAIAIVGLTESLMVVVYTLSFGLAIGATATVARRVGEKNPDAAARAAVQAISLGLVVAATVGGLGAVFADDLLRMMGASPEIVASGTSFARVALGGSVSVFLLFVINATFRGAGDAAVAMRVLWIANACNLVLDPLLIFGVGPFPQLGVTGAAVATTIGRTIGVVYALYRLSHDSGHLIVRQEHVTISPRAMLQLARLCSAGTFQILVGSAAWVGLVRILASFGSVAVAGYTIAIRVVIFALLPAFGLSNAAATMVGQSLGARDPQRAERSVWAAARYNVAFLGGIGVLFVLLAPWIVGTFTQEPDVARFATTGLRVVGLGFPLFAAGMVMIQAFNGAGDTWTPTWLNLGVYWVFEIPFAWWLATHTAVGASGVFWSVTLAYSALAVAAALLFRGGRWKAKVV